ncbi:doublesex- and mab-3-related transcription factor 1-like [Pempheris klunzingeri]|uniref:doublesex- and mab-3-related transcription factor 1-like n=1 Tax=Pempheris klunzingeri TaxID=3127111 RepID=UPI0039808013
MSLSKQQLSVEEPPRQPKCTRCRHHGIIVPQKGHVKFCPFLTCDCWKCYLITQRTRITALQRDLKRGKSKEQRPGGGKPAADGGACSASDADGGARPSATGGPMRPPAGGALERADTTASSPPEPRSRPAAGGDDVPHFGPTAPLHHVHFPFRMSGHYPGGYAPFPNALFNMPWLPPVPAGLYSGGLCGPLMFSHYESGAVLYPPPSEPGPPADCREPPSTPLTPQALAGDPDAAPTSIDQL